MTLKENQIVIVSIFLVILNALATVTMSLFAKLLCLHFGASEVVFLRNSFAFIALALWLMFSGNLRILKTKRPFAHIVRGAIGTAGIVFGTTALSMMPLAETTILFLTWPLFVVLLSYPILREPVSLYEILAALIGFLGIAITTNPSSDIDTLPTLGIILGLCWGLSAAGVNLSLRWLGRTENSTSTVFYFLLFGIATTGLHLPFAAMPESGFTLNIFWIIAGVGTATLCGQLSKTQGHRMAKASILAPFGYTTIIWSMLYDYLMWNRLPGIHVIIGASLIVGSNLFILYKKSNSRRQTTVTKNQQNS